MTSPLHLLFRVVVSIVSGCLLVCTSLAQVSEYPLLSIRQHNQEVAIEKQTVTLDRAPFELVFKLKPEFPVFGMLAGSELAQPAPGGEAMREVLLAAQGAASSDFNPGKSIFVFNGTVLNYLAYENDSTYRFNSVSKEGEWLIATLEIANLNTKEGSFSLADWPGTQLNILGAPLTSKEEPAHPGRFYCQLTFQPFASTGLLDVRGKSFEGEAGEWQEGCEGCGNGGYFEFSKDGHSVEYLWPGSDIIEVGHYTRSGNQIIFEEGSQSLTIAADGKSLTDNKYGTVFQLK